MARPFCGNKFKVISKVSVSFQGQLYFKKKKKNTWDLPYLLIGNSKGLHVPHAYSLWYHVQDHTCMKCKTFTFDITFEWYDRAFISDKTFLFVTNSRSAVKVTFQGHLSLSLRGIHVSQTHLVFI